MPYRNLLLTVLIICVLAPGVSAQQPDPEEAPTRLEEIVVIGSRIQGRSITDSPVPVDLIKQEDMRNTGQLEVGRAIQRLIPSFNFSSSTISDGTDAVRPATLRGMGPDQVLVLLNGKRRHGSALIHVNTSVGRGNTGTDMNAIPMGAIKRIEVLRDGASAQYGSDAIAGVINVILKDDYEGGFRTNYGTTYEGDGDQFLASLDKGFKIGEDGTLHATFEYRNRQRTNRAGLTGSIQYPDTQTCMLSDCTAAQLPNKADLESYPGDTTVILNDPGDKEKNFNRRNFRIGDADSEQFSGALSFEKIHRTWSRSLFLCRRIKAGERKRWLLSKGKPRSSQSRLKLSGRIFAADQYHDLGLFVWRGHRQRVRQWTQGGPRSGARRKHVQFQYHEFP